MLISLIIPFYNCLEYMDETFQSVLSQLPDNCELIVVDDGSDDGTAERLAGLQKELPENVKVFLREHGGVSFARNAGLDMAGGEWIAFMDCDDCLMEGFFEKCISLLDDLTDLYIFSFDRVELPEGRAAEERIYPMEVADRVYEIVSDFADEYIRTRLLLVYSSCNKLYRRHILDEYKIRFKTGIDFGEDRLFNYEYLPHCGRIRTSSVRMFRYMQRNPDSASNRFFPNYYDTIKMLHKAKMNCFLTLSEGTGESEKKAFEDYDWSTELGRMTEKKKQDV